jgi:hypothetical protein
LPHLLKRVQRYGDISVPPNLFALFISLASPVGRL